MKQRIILLEKDVAIKEAEIKGIYRSGNINEILESVARTIDSTARLVDFFISSSGR